MREYWKRVLRRAWADALSASGWRGLGNLIFKAISIIAAYLLVLFVLNDASGVKSLLEKTFVAVVAFPVVLLFFFSFFVFLAPMRVDRDLRKELAEYQSPRKRKLSFGSAEIFERTTGALGSASSLIIRIGVINTSDSPAAQARGRLLQVEFASNGDFAPTEYAEALALPWAGTPQGEAMITLEPKLTEWLEIAQLSADGGFRLCTLTASAQYPYLLLKNESQGGATYRFKIGAYADGCEPITHNITIAVNGSGLSMNGLTTSLKMHW